MLKPNKKLLEFLFLLSGSSDKSRIRNDMMDCFVAVYNGTPSMSIAQARSVDG